MHTMGFMREENDLKNNWFTTFSASIKSHTLVPLPRSVSPIVLRDDVAAQLVMPVNVANNSTAFVA